MRWLKVGSVIFGAIAITALGIDAADTLQGSRSTLLGQLAASDGGECPSGMVAVDAASSFSCVDMYEASAGPDCPIEAPGNELESRENASDSTCAATSEEHAMPWRYIDRESAQTVCVRAGKRLPTNEEWQLIAAGTPDALDACNIAGSGAARTGTHSSCMSAAGIFDAVGNVWEWTHDDVFDGTYNGRTLPAEGYVRQVDKGGVATLTGTSSSEHFGTDYFWSKEQGAYAILRGGYFGSKSDAGVYSVHAATLPTMVGAGIGFRCVQ